MSIGSTFTIEYGLTIKCVQIDYLCWFFWRSIFPSLIHSVSAMCLSSFFGWVSSDFVYCQVVKVCVCCDSPWWVWEQSSSCWHLACIWDPAHRTTTSPTLLNILKWNAVSLQSGINAHVNWQGYFETESRVWTLNQVPGNVLDEVSCFDGKRLFSRQHDAVDGTAAYEPRMT